MMSKLEDFVMAHPELHDWEPCLVHTTPTREVSKVFDKKILKKEFDSLLGTDAVFFFLGKPSYRLSRNKTNGSDSSPSCFIFEQKDFDGQAYPFDTGAYDKLREKIENFSPLENFALRVETRSHMHYIGSLYKWPLSYFNAKPDNPDLREFARELIEYENCLSAAMLFRDDKELDDRAATVELHTTSDKSILNGDLKLVIAPKDKFDQRFAGGTFGDYIENVLGARYRGYDAFDVLPPAEHTSVLYQIVREELF